MRIERVRKPQRVVTLGLALLACSSVTRHATALGCATSIQAVEQAAVLRAEPSPSIVVINASDDSDWDGVVCVSIPWPRGAVPIAPSRVKIGDDIAPCSALMSWPDGSVAVLQAWPRVRVMAASRASFAVVLLEESASSMPTVRTIAADSRDLPIRTVLEGPFGESYAARLVSTSVVAIGELDAETPRVALREFHGVHTAIGDARAEPGQLLGACAHLVEFPSEHRAVLTLLLDNDPPPTDPAFGPVRFRSFALETTSADVEFAPRFAAENLLGRAQPIDDGVPGAPMRRRLTLLGPSDQLYLGDRTAKAWRFDLWFGDGAERASAARARAAQHVIALPECEWTRHTRAFGMHGGPAPTPSHAAARSARLVRLWRTSARFGPFGDFGDPADAAAQGTPRNGPSALHAVVSLASQPLWQRAEAQVLQHPLRPTPGHDPRLPAAHAKWRQGMSPRTIERPYGFTRVDYEHFSVDLVFDWYWLTGDPLARTELARFARGLLPVLDGVPFRTSRGEGWCLQAGAAIARALGDRALLRAVRDRFVERVLPEMGRDGQPFAIRQPPHDLVFGRGDHPFDAPWQMAALVHGLLAVLRETDGSDPPLADAAIRTARVMAEAGWLDGVGPKCFVSALDPARYRLPVGHGPLEGTAHFQIGAFVLAAELVGELRPDDPVKGLLASRADSLMSAAMPSGASDSLRLPVVDPWFQLYLDRHR